MSEEAKEALKRSIWGAFDTWSAKYYDDLLYGDHLDKEAALKEARLQDLFLSKRVFIPGFTRYITKAVTSNPDHKRKRKTLVKASLLSMLRPSGVIIDDLKGSSTDEDLYGRRHIQRIIQGEYSELFYEIEKQRKDKRVTPLSTSFSPFSFPELERPFKVLMAIKEMRERTLKQDDLIAWMTRNYSIIRITPEYQEDFIEFRNDCLEVLKGLNDNADICKVMFRDLKQDLELTSVFHAHLLSIRSVMWYRSRSDSIKRSLIDDGFSLKYDEADAEKARIFITDLTDAQNAYWTMQIGAASLNKMKLFESANIIYNELLKSEGLDWSMKGILHENLAINHRYLKQPKLMVREMHLALDNYLKSEDNYRISLGYKNLGEAEWRLGFKQTAIDYFKEAVSGINELTYEEREGVYRNLSFTAWRIGNVKMEIECLHKWMTANPDSPVEVILEINRRIEMLLSNRNEKEPRLYVGPI